MSTQPVVINIENPKKTWSSKRKKKAITKLWNKKGSSKSARRRKKTIHPRGKTQSNSRIQKLDDLRGKVQSNSNGKSQSNSNGKIHSKSRTQLDELYKAFISCEPNCAICDKYILDFSQHFKLIHTHTPIPSRTAENLEKLDGLDPDSDDSDDVPLQFYVTKKTKPEKVKTSMRKINMTKKRKLINKVSCETADLGIPSPNSDVPQISDKQKQSETFLSNINSNEFPDPPRKKLKSKCGRSMRVKKKMDYAEILNRNAEVENESESDKITLKSRELFSHTENPNPTSNFVIVLENIKSEADDQDQEIVIPEELDFDDMGLSESDLGQISHSSMDRYTTEDLGHLSQLVTESTHQVNTADSDERQEDQNENAVDEDFLDNLDPMYTPMEEDNDNDSESDSAQNPDESDNNDDDEGSVSQMNHCDHCTRKYLRLHELKRHLQKCHADLIEKPFVCIHCITEDVRFYNSIKLNAHVRAVHPGQKSFVCTICTEGFYGKSALEEHFMKHTGERPFECPHCEKRYRTKHALNSHVIIHTVGKHFHCDYGQCDKSFCSESQLNHHRISHSAEKPYMCDQCSKRFHSLGQLNTHMSIHGERSKICEHCGKGFKTDRHLKRHVMIHTGEKPHQCELCGRFFRLRQTLRFHLKCTHGIDKFVPASE